MIIDKFVASLDLEKGKADALRDALKRDSFYRKILYRIGVIPGAIEGIMQTVDTSDIDTAQEDILTEKARVEWVDFIPADKRK